MSPAQIIDADRPPNWSRVLMTSPEKLRRQRFGPYRTGEAKPPYIIEPLHAEYRAGRRYELMKPFVVLSAIVGKVTVEKGYITDFHSIPEMFWNILPFDDWAEGSVPHDKLCNPPHRGDGDGERIVTWQEAAAVHREITLHVGAPRWRAETMYAAIYTFGPHW